MKTHSSLSYGPMTGEPRPRKTRSSRQRPLPLTGALAFIGCLTILIALPGCMVRQATHDEALQKIQSLQTANMTLKTALDTAQHQNKRTAQGSLGATNNRQLQDMLSRLVTDVRGQVGAWEIQYQQVPMMVITSESHDRMRIMAMVGDENLAKEANLFFLMEANFDRALDARYALLQGKLWAVYLHPLGALTEAQLTSALMQVANLVKTYGTTYSSSSLQFQGYK